jgi:phosphatidylserine/phosphatidylglycerophosphate/cardiolipin synthase-like enzyme
VNVYRSALVLALALTIFSPACGPSAIPGVPKATDSKSWYQAHRLERLLDTETDSKVMGGNSIELLINGEAAFARRYENLETATFVLVKTFIWTDDAAGRKMAETIAEIARGGTPVIIQYDVKGNIGSIADVQDMLSRVSTTHPVGEPKVIALLREAGATVIATNSPGRPMELKEWAENSKRFFHSPGQAVLRSLESLVLFDHVDHDKYFVTGHEGGEVRAILGGLNIASEYAFGGIPDIKDPETGRGGWRDTDIEIRGPTALQVVDEFFEDIGRHQGEPAPESLRTAIYKRINATTYAGDANLRFVTNNPLFGEKKHMDRVFRILIQATPKKEHIFFSTPYFAPSKELRKAMHDHMDGGGTIAVLTNSSDSSDITIITDAGRYSARELMKTDSFVLYERKPRPDLGEQMLHQKVASFGTHGPMVIGSANLDAQSFVHNGEAVVVVQDAELRKDFDAMVAKDIDPARARRIPRSELNAPSVVERLRQFSAGELAWYWL